MQALSRRQILALGGMGALTGGLGSPVAAGAATPGEQENARLVTAFCAAWAARDLGTLVPYLADTITYRITETTAPIVGRAAFETRIGSILARLTRIEFAVVETWAKGPIVMNERHDVLVSPQRTQRFHAVGMFFLVDRKIVEWTDYIITEG